MTPRQRIATIVQYGKDRGSGWFDILGQLRTSDLLVLDPDDPQPGLDWAGAMIDGSPTGDEAAEFLDGSNLINPTPAKPEGTRTSDE